MKVAALIPLSNVYLGFAKDFLDLRPGQKNCAKNQAFLCKFRGFFTKNDPWEFTDGSQGAFGALLATRHLRTSVPLCSGQQLALFGSGGLPTVTVPEFFAKNWAFSGHLRVNQKQCHGHQATVTLSIVFWAKMKSNYAIKTLSCTGLICSLTLICPTAP